MDKHTAVLLDDPAVLRAPLSSLPRPEGRIRELDGLRGLAIVLVVLLHYVKDGVTGTGALYSLGLAPLRLAGTSVDLFFVLSGFLIGGNLLNVKRSDTYFRTFYLRRFYRILPVYFLWLLLFACGLALADPRMKGMFNQTLPLWSYPLFLQNFAMAIQGTYGAQWVMITWSLAVEEQFYLILPLAIRRLDGKRMLYLSIVAIVCAPLVRSVLWFAGYPLAAYVLLPCRGDSLGAGVLLALLVRRPEALAWLERNRVRLYGTLVLLWCGTFVFAAKPNGLLATTAGYTWMAAFYLNLLTLAVVKPGRAERLVFGNALLVRMGIISYTVYICHHGVNGLVHKLLRGTTPVIDSWHSAAITASAFILVIAIAAASWRFLENPLVERARSRFRYGAQPA